ncbi:MAG TPA: DUF6212 domain-containing protein [Rhizomicrobium sp.]|jgi:hypothetical protein
MKESWPSAKSRPRMFMHAHEMARNFSGGPLLVVSSKFRLAQPVGFSGWSIPVLLAEVDANGSTYLFREESELGRQDVIEVHQPPSDVLAIIASEDDAGCLSQLWNAAGASPAPVVTANSFEEAAQQVMVHCHAEIRRIENRCAELQRALVTTRIEYEETRDAMQGLMRSLSYQHSATPRLVATAAPSLDNRTIALAHSSPLRQPLPVGTEGITSIALHVAAPVPADTSELSVLLLGSESGRVLGQWQVPGSALHPGWNVLDLPIPVGPIRETAELQVSSSNNEHSPLLLSASDEKVRDEAGRPDERLLAARIWVAPAGGRFMQADHWVWNAIGRASPPDGAALSVSSSSLERVSARGRLRFERNSEGGSIRAELRGGSSLLIVPDVSLREVGAIRIELGAGVGDLSDTRFELVADSNGKSVSTGWRAFHFPEKTMSFGLSLPVSQSDTADIILRIEDTTRRAAEFGAFEIRKLDLIVGNRVPDADKLERPTAREAWPGAADLKALPRFADLKLNGHNATDTYELFDVSINRLEFGTRSEPVVRFKFTQAKGLLSVEFRKGGAGKRQIFQHWPGSQQDRHGEFFRIGLTVEGVAIGCKLVADADRRLVLVLLRLLPTIVATALQMTPADADKLQQWIGAARQLSKTAQHKIEEVSFK